MHEKIHIAQSSPMSIKSKTIFGYDYIAISGIAAAIGIFMFSVSIFTGSESFPLFNLDKLSAKNVEEKVNQNISSDNLVAEDDSLIENEDLELPKIHLVGGKK